MSTSVIPVIGLSQALIDVHGDELNGKQREYVAAILPGGEGLNEVYSGIIQVAGLESG